MKADNIDSVIKFLQDLGIKVTYDSGPPGEFNRVIEFEVEGTTYFINWYVNQSYLKFKNKFSVPNLPFKYINAHCYSPTSLHRWNLCFYQSINQEDINSCTYNEIPFGAFRIPFNKYNK